MSMRFDEKKKKKKKNSISTNLPIIQQEKKKKVGRSDKRAKLQTTSVTREYYLTSNGERTRGQIVIFLRTSWGTNYSQW